MWPTSEAPGGRPVQNRKFIIEIKVVFLTIFIHTKTLYDEIRNIFWRLLGGERYILIGRSWRSMLLKITFLTTFISIVKLCNQIWQNYSLWFLISTNYRQLGSWKKMPPGIKKNQMVLVTMVPSFMLLLKNTVIKTNSIR